VPKHYGRVEVSGEVHALADLPRKEGPP